MDFALNEEQRMFQKMFRDFVTNEVAPLAEEIDGEEKLPRELLEKTAMQGFLGALLPEEFEGVALDAISYCLLLEELARACTSTAMTISVHNGLVSKTILDNGSDEQKGKYLEPMAFGEKIGCFALTEPAAGSDVTALATRARRDGGDYVLNGCKTWASNGGIADIFLVFAITDPDVEPKGISAFIVERDTPGFKVGYREPTMGLRGLTCNTLYFDDCRVPAENLLGQEGEGFKIAMRALDFARLSLSAICLGGAQAALEAGIQFAIEHEEFGGPIALKQAIQNFIADAASEIQALRYLVYHTAWLADTGATYTRDASMAKLIGSEIAMRAANKMLQVHGGFGYMKEYAIERMYRDFRALQIMEGTSEIQRFIIARDILKEKGLVIKP
ncbi:MAG: acyl-CoA dehydrogenase [Chloroflexi bacterium]|nr:acyl-CoA dehydrogenase [Chloroflexota bacterium]